MRRVIFRGSILRAILVAISVALALSAVPRTASGQFAGARPGGVPRVNTPRVFARPVFFHRTFIRVRPIFPIFAPPQFAFWGVPFYDLGLGFGFNSTFWRNCGPYAGGFWAYNCYAVPVYISDGGSRELPQLYMKDGTVYNVTDYWLVDNQLHFTTIDESGTKWVEHTVDFDQLDLQKTVEVSKLRGFHFLLRNEPLQQYLQDHPEIGAPGAAQPQSAQPPK
jgi:hypothetical protein